MANYPIECRKHIPRYSPEQVFEVGIQRDVVPARYKNFSLRMSQRQFDLGVEVGIGVDLGFKAIEVEAEVVEFEPARRVVIKGSDKRFGSAALWLALAEDEAESGAQIDFGLQVTHQGLKQMLLQEPLFNFLDVTAPRYADLYIQNVQNNLNQKHPTLRRAA